jgi:hypothetical protein
MAIQISGTTVIDNSRNLTNTVNITASGTISGDIVATQAVAQAGTDNTKLMTPLRVAEAIAALGGQVINRIQRGSTLVDATGPSPGGGPSPVVGSTSVPITTIDVNKSMISQGDRGNAVATASPFGNNILVGSASARITSSTVVTVTSGTTFAVTPGFPPPVLVPNSATVDWEVIEFK